MVVRLASSTGSVGLTCSSSRAVALAVSGAVRSRFCTSGSLFAICSVVPARLRAHILVESAVFARESSSGAASSVSVRVRSEMLLASPATLAG
jgi:hypothetical protein